MKFLMNLDDKKRQLLDKVRRGTEKFTREDEFLFTTDFELRKEVFQILSSGREIWTPSISDFFYNNTKEEDVEFLNEDIFNYCCLSKIDSGKLDEVEELTEYVDKDIIYQYLLEKLKEPNYTFSTNFGNLVATALIETERYSLFSNLKRGYVHSPRLDNDTLKKVLQNYPYSFKNLGLDIPKEILEEVQENYEDLNVYVLLEIFLRDIEHIFPILRRKMFDSTTDMSKSINPFSLGRDFYSRKDAVEQFYELLSPEEKLEFEKKMILVYPEWYLKTVSEESIRENISLLAQSLENRYQENAYAFEGIEKMLEGHYFLYSCPEIVETFLRNGDFRNLFRSPIVEQYIFEIMDAMKTMKKNSLNSDRVVSICERYPEFWREGIRNNVFPIEILPYALQYPHLNQIYEEEMYQYNTVVDLVELDVATFKKLILCGNIETIIKNLRKIDRLDCRKKSFPLSSEESQKLVELLSENLELQERFFNYATAFVFDNPILFQFYKQSNFIMLEKVIDYINHHEELSRCYTSELYQDIKEYYAQKYHLNITNLDKIEFTFGPSVIRYFDNSNIIRMTQLSPDKLDKLIALFPKTDYNVINIEAMYDSLKQYAFSRENPDIINIFTHIRHSIEDNDKAYLKDIEELVAMMDDKFFAYMAKEAPNALGECKSSPISFMRTLVLKIQSTIPEEKEEAINFLHIITNYYISQKREEYHNHYEMEKDLNLPYTLDSKDLEKKLMPYIIHKDVRILRKENGTKRMYSMLELVIQELEKKGMENSLAIDVLAYYAKQDHIYRNDIEVVKKNIRFAIPAIKKIMGEVSDDYIHFYTQKLDEAGMIKRIYHVPECTLDIYQILSTLRIDVIEKKILEDDCTQIYQSLKNTMEKYKLHRMPSCFQNLLESESIKISCVLGNLSGLIYYYHQVYETEKKRLESQGKDTTNIQLNAVNILLNADVLSSVSNVYSQFLGIEDAKLVKANPGPNQAIKKTTGNERLEEALNWTIQNFRRMKVTIPTFSEQVSCSDFSKKLQATVGNFTHPSNITHGERTGACMRIGGVGDTLFNFCLEDVNGFHIRFEDPQTGEYISRVSGFRNGNTVFLNELRNSCNKSLYSDLDVVEACKRVAEMLIEKSKGSTCPIENVVVAKAYATADMKDVYLGITDNKKGLKRFYSDIQSSGIILASTETSFAPVNFDKSNVPTYLPAREKAYMGSNIEYLASMINRVHSVNSVLSGEDYQYVEPMPFENSISYGIANQDWYIYVDCLGNIHEEIIALDKRALKEIEVARAMIVGHIPKKEEVEAYQM